ncbi:MAG: hypothetical protein RSF40_08895 [Oscillospiraceae bacterium]
MDDYQQYNMVNEIPSNPRRHKPQKPNGKEPPMWAYMMVGAFVVYLILKYG